jgi:hypothetical protein
MKFRMVEFTLMSGEILKVAVEEVLKVYEFSRFARTANQGLVCERRNYCFIVTEASYPNVIQIQESLDQVEVLLAAHNGIN